MLSHYNDCALRTPLANITETPTLSPEQTFKWQQMIINSFITKMTAADQKELESLFTRAIYSTGIPFNILENEDMKAFLQKLVFIQITYSPKPFNHSSWSKM